jgi:carbonic anhydrase
MNAIHKTALAISPLAYWHKFLLPCGLAVALMTGTTPASHAATADHAAPAAADHGGAAAPAAHKTTAKKTTEPASAVTEEKDLGTDIKAALKDKLIDKKNLTLVIKDKPVPKPAAPAAKAADHGATPAPAVAHAAASHGPAVANPRTSRDYIKAKAAAMTGHEAPAAGGDAHGGEVHWTYDGATGPQAWGQLKPEFNICAIGKRQSPINIEESVTLQGPAEPLQFNYTPSSGTVVNNGHTIQVDLQGDNSLTVRGSVYRLVQFHFHTPSEEQVNYRNFAMVAHLVHKNAEGQLAVVAVLLEPGVINSLVGKVWTYMPLDTSDKVRLPTDIINMNELLPKDQRYYQFIGSLTTPPCTEGVLWMVLKQPTQISKDQLKLFQQLFPNNARPVQAVNGRPVRNAQ